MGFFDFLSGRPGYGPAFLSRLNLRHRFIIEPFVRVLDGATVLDLACNDGRWSYAAAAAGAAKVVGIEARQHNIARFRNFPDAPFKKNIELLRGDIFDHLRRMRADGMRFDIVYMLGIFYHIMDHYGLLKIVSELQPGLIVVDGTFMTLDWPCIGLFAEATDNNFNSMPYLEDQAIAPKGIPSQPALELMARTLGYGVEWMDWNTVPDQERLGGKDYFRPGDTRRFTCALRPAAPAPARQGQGAAVRPRAGHTWRD